MGRTETIEGILEGMAQAVFVSAPVLFTQVCFYLAVKKNVLQILEMSHKKQHGNASIIQIDHLFKLAFFFSFVGKCSKFILLSEGKNKCIF